MGHIHSQVLDVGSLAEMTVVAPSIALPWLDTILILTSNWSEAHRAQLDNSASSSPPWTITWQMPSHYSLASTGAGDAHQTVYHYQFFMTSGSDEWLGMVTQGSQLPQIDWFVYMGLLPNIFTVPMSVWLMTNSDKGDEVIILYLFCRRIMSGVWCSESLP